MPNCVSFLFKIRTNLSATLHYFVLRVAFSSHRLYVNNRLYCKLYYIIYYYIILQTLLLFSYSLCMWRMNRKQYKIEGTVIQWNFLFTHSCIEIKNTTFWWKKKHVLIQTRPTVCSINVCNKNTFKQAVEVLLWAIKFEMVSELGWCRN